MINMTDTKGRTIWIASNRREFEQHIPGLRERGEPYRIVNRTVSAMGGSVEVSVLVIYPRKTDR